eukprot:gene10984-11066_t
MDGSQKVAVSGHYRPRHSHQQTQARHRDEHARTEDRKPQAKAEPDDKPDGETRKMSPARKWLYIVIGILVLAALIVGGVLYWLDARRFESTDDAFIDGHNAQIAPQVAARVIKVAIDDNQMVQQGQLLVQLDPRDYQIRLDQAVTQKAQMQAQLEQARAQVLLQQAQIEQSAAQVRVGEAELTQAQQDFNRFRAIDPKAITRQQLDNAQATLRTSQAKLDANRQALTGAQAQLVAQQAQVANAEAALQGADVTIRNAQLQLSYTEIHAPEAGRVTRRVVEAGNFVNPGQMLLGIVRPGMWVTANFKETQLAHMRAGQPVDVRVDALPDKVFHGRIESFQAGSGSVFSSLPAENATGNYVKVVQRIPVKITIDDADDPMLSLGMSVTPKVTVRHTKSGSSAPSDQLPRSAAGPNNPWLVAIVVSIATFMEVLDTTIANVALRHIAGALGAGQDESTYIITSYLVSNAIILPISGWLANVIGRKRFYMSCVALFTFSSVMCAFAPSLWIMLGFRVLQGFGGGGLAPVEQSIFADTFPPSKRAIAFALYGFTIVTAPAIGPVLGGIITDNISWHWVFLINLPVGLLSLTLTWFFVYDSDTVKKERRDLLARGLKIDYLGFVLVALTFGTLQVVLDRFERDDGFSSGFILTMTAICVTSAITLIIWELNHPQPLMNLRLLKSRAFAISNIVLFLFGFIIISTTQLTPQLTQELLHYDATNAGMTLGLGGIITVFIMPISGIVTGKLVQPKLLVFAALIGIGFALRHSAGLNLNVTFGDLSLSRAVLVMWLPFIFIPLSAVQFIGVPPDKNNDASALLNLMRNLGGSAGVAVATTQLAWRGQFHHARLAEHIGPATGYPLTANLTSIAQSVQLQASILSYLDVFTILAFIAFAAAPLALFLPRMPKGGAVGAH